VTEFEVVNVPVPPEWIAAEAAAEDAALDRLAGDPALADVPRETLSELRRAYHAELDRAMARAILYGEAS
jgi:hypothetical protein